MGASEQRSTLCSVGSAPRTMMSRRSGGAAGRQDGEGVVVVRDVPPPPQLRRVADPAADDRADLIPARGVARHQPVDLGRATEISQHGSVGPGRYRPPRRLQRPGDCQEPVREAWVHDHQGVHVRGDLRVVREEGRAVALPTGRGVVPVGERERQQRSLGRSVGVAHQQSADANVEALELAEDAVGTYRPGVEGDGQRDHEGTPVAGGQVVDPLGHPVGVGVDES